MGGKDRKLNQKQKTHPTLTLVKATECLDTVRIVSVLPYLKNLQNTTY